MGQIARFQEHFPEGMDAVLIASGANRFYFTGLNSSAGTLLLTPEDAILLIDSRYIELARSRVKDCTVELETDLGAQLRGEVQRRRLHRIGVETGYLSMQRMKQLARMVRPAELLEDDRANDAILLQRRIKTPEEIQCLARAQSITDAAFSEVLEVLRPGLQELEAAIHLGTAMSRLGSQRRSFDFILTSGPKTSLPHGGGEQRTLQRGDFVLMDMGSLVDGYGSDMTRTVFLGEADEEHRTVYEIVLEAQRRALAAIRPGVSCRDVDSVARDYIISKGYGDYFGHGLGHSLGVEIHENPRFNQLSEDRLEPGMVMTVEPGIYLPGHFGVRIEDMVVVTPEGCRNLTGSPKELICLDT